MQQLAFTYDYVCVKPEHQIGYHSQPTWELAYIICGAGRRTIGDKSAPIAEGEIILIPPGIPHGWNFDSEATDPDGNISNITVFFAPILLDGIEMLFPETKTWVNHLRSMTDAMEYAGETHKRLSRLLSDMRYLRPESRLPKMLEMLELISKSDNGRPIGINTALDKTERRLEKIRVFCSCNYAREIKLDEIASHTGMNKSAFCRFMRRNAGKSFSQYLNDFRLERAVERLLHSDDGIAETAYSVGFSNVTYFNRLFKSHYGFSPKNIRKKTPAAS